jgi:hypothetical protein
LFSTEFAYTLPVFDEVKAVQNWNKRFETSVSIHSENLSCNFERHQPSKTLRSSMRNPWQNQVLPQLLCLFAGMGDSETVTLMRALRPMFFLTPVLLAMVFGGTSQAQSAPQSGFVASGSIINTPGFVGTAAVARLSPDVALATYERGLQQQSADLAGYTATTVIDAALPDSAQKAEFELERRYSSPSSLEFTPLRSSGDKFVKNNVIARLLQSEVEHVQRREQAQTAITSANYKFSYKGTLQIDGIAAHVYDAKPRQKRVGLFKGKIFVDAATGTLLRAQGKIVKSPSFFIKRIEFVQDYAAIDGFTLPTHLHSEAQARIIGKTIVDITHRDYQPQSAGGSGLLEAVTLIDGKN